MKKNIYVTKTFIEDESYSELDFELQDKFEFKYNDDNDFIIIEKGHGNTDEAHPIEIDVLVNKLNEMRDNGATHVEIEHHCDHIGYDISAYNIHLSTKDEISEYEDDIIKKSEKNKKLGELYKEIHKLKNEE